MAAGVIAAAHRQRLIAITSFVLAAYVGFEAIRNLITADKAEAPRHGFPDVRVGMHTGTAVHRGADWFGSAVNTAARVAQLAGPGDVLLTAATRAAADSPPAVRLEDCGHHEPRHIGEPAHLYRATSVTEDRTGHSSLCAGQFSRSPERYLRDLGRARL